MPQPSWLERKQLLTLEQAAIILNISTNALNSILSMNKFPWVRSIIGAKCRIHPQDLYDYMLANKFFPDKNSKFRLADLVSKLQRQEELGAVHREPKTTSPQIKHADEGFELMRQYLREPKTTSPQIKHEVQTVNPDQDSLKEEIWHLVDAFLERRESSATVQRKLEQNDEVHKAKYRALEYTYDRLNSTHLSTKSELQALKEEHERLKVVLKRTQSSATVQKKLEQNEEVNKAKYKAIEDAYGELNTVFLRTKNELQTLKKEHERLKETSHKLEQKVAEIQIELNSSAKVGSIKHEAVTEVVSPERSELQEVVNHQSTETLPEARDSASPVVEEPMSPQPERKGIAPIKRGGKPRDTAPEPKRQKAHEQEHKPLMAKPEVICWSRQRQWFLGIEVPEEFLDKYEVEVFQNELLLAQDESADNRWLLEQPVGRVKAQWTEAGTTNKTAIELEGEPYFIFKLSGSDQKFGRRIKTPSSGLHLVAVPQSWKCDEEASTDSHTYLGDSSLAGYHTYLLIHDNDKQVTFHTPTNETIIIGRNSAEFSLVGTKLWNADENIGPLFGESAPRIRASSPQAWADIKTVVIGEEGRGANKWRIQFTPDTRNIEQELPPQLAQRKGGWYFLRFYNHDDNLTESLDFRFLSALKEIRWDEPSPLPLNGQHKLVQLEFVHEPNCVIEAHDSDAKTFPKQVRDIAGNKRTAFTLLADPKYDQTRWRIQSQDGLSIETTVLLERVWWSLGNEDQEPSEWTDKILSLLRSNRSASSNQAIWLRFPRPRWIDEVSVGFATVKKYNLGTTKNTVAVPLRDFSDANEFESIGTSLLKLSMHREGKTYTLTLCELLITAKCKHKGCDFVAVSEREILDHIESTHLKSMFPLLTYEELRDLDPTLPTKIYQCSYCAHFIKGSAHFKQSPTSAISGHLEKHHPGKEHKFRVVAEVKEIRQSVIKDLPIIHKCTICKRKLIELSQSKMIQHLVDNHKSLLYELL